MAALGQTTSARRASVSLPTLHRAPPLVVPHLAVRAAARPLQRQYYSGSFLCRSSSFAPSQWCQPTQSTVAASTVLAAAAAALLLVSPGTAWAAPRERVGEFQASGLLFKDTVEVNALDDPDVPGVTVYFSDFKRSLVDKLQKDFFSEPSQASLTCSISPNAAVTDTAALGGPEGREVFAEKKGLSLFKDKTLRVRRLYDPSRQTLLYVAYSTRLSTAADEGSVSTGRYRTSVCALRLPEVAGLSSNSAAAALAP